MPSDAFNITPPPSSSSNTVSPHPIQLDTFNRPVRQTIPYKQFQKTPLPPTRRSLEETQDKYNSSEDEDTDYWDQDLDELEPEHNTEPEASSRNRDLLVTGSRDGSTGGPNGSGHRRRRSTLLSNLDGSSGHSHQSSRRASPQKRGEKFGGDDDGESSDQGLDGLSDDGLTDDEETGLTEGERKNRGRRKRRNTLMDSRVAGNAKLSKEVKKEADQNVVKNLVINGFLIGLWYIFSLSISIYNKWMFSPDHLDFHFPLFTTSMHMLVQFMLASLVLFFFPRFRPRHDSISNPDLTPHMTENERRLHVEESKKPLMTRWFYASRLGPCAVATGLDIGLGNMSLKFITLTFYTMVKSSSLAFVLLFAFVFHLEHPSIILITIITVMTCGVILMVSGEASFSLPGFVLILSAAFFSGFRWALTQILLLRNPATSNPFSSIFFLAPIMFTTLLILALFTEGLSSVITGLGSLIEVYGTLKGPGILLFPGVIAFCMTSSEFALLQRTSVVTLSIAGIFKEVVTISAAALVFGDVMTPINVSGLLVTIGAIAAYNYIKIRKMRQEAREKLSSPAGKNGADGYFAVGDADADDVTATSKRDESMVHHVTTSGDILLIPQRPVGPERIKSKDVRTAPPIPSIAGRA